jgi:hypothetical protein
VDWIHLAQGRDVVNSCEGSKNVLFHKRQIISCNFSNY